MACLTQTHDAADHGCPVSFPSPSRPSGHGLWSLLPSPLSDLLLAHLPFPGKAAWPVTSVPYPPGFCSAHRPRG